MPLNFTAIDFETANEQRGSVCAVGVAQIRDGQLAHTASWFVAPPTGERFTNSHIHGITADHVRGASTWAQSLDAIGQWAGGYSLVAYNSPFDKGVYNAASMLTAIDAPLHQWRCALTLAKSRLDLPGYRLPQVAAHLGVNMGQHHDAHADAVACALVTSAISDHTGIDTIDDLWLPTTITRRFRNNTSDKLPESNTAADPRHVLYGVSLTFSGELEAFSRAEARTAAAALGANVTTTPTKKTEIIVLGGFDPATFRAGMSVSAKVQKALDLRASGQRIELLSEADFIACLNYDPDQDRG